MQLKNQGKVPILYYAWGEYPYGCVKIQTSRGVTNDRLAPPYTGGYVVLQPDASSFFHVRLPMETMSWQCSFSVETANIRDRSVWSLARSGIWDSLPEPLKYLVDVLPNTPGKTVKVESAKFEIGSALNAELPPE